MLLSILPAVILVGLISLAEILILANLFKRRRKFHVERGKWKHR